MSLIIYDQMKPANDTFKLVDVKDINYNGKSLAERMFVVLTRAQYASLAKAGRINPYTPYLIVEEEVLDGDMWGL